MLCLQHPHPKLGPSVQALQTQRCLAALSPAILFALSTSDHELLLDDSQCPDCPLAYVQTAIAETVTRSNDWLEVLPDMAFVRLRSEEDEDPIMVEQRPVHNPAMAPVSRRGLFSTLRTAREKAATPEEGMEMVKSGRAVPISDRLPQTLPHQHAKIISILEQHASPEIPLLAPAGFDVDIDEARCTACTLCAKFCPTGALEFSSSGESFDLRYQPSLCLGRDCGICVPACPEKAVSVSQNDEPHALLIRASLLEGHLTRCRRCRQPVRAGSDLPDTCFACRPTQNLSDLNAGHLDLLWD